MAWKSGPCGDGKIPHKIHNKIPRECLFLTLEKDLQAPREASIPQLEYPTLQKMWSFFMSFVGGHFGLPRPAYGLWIRNKIMRWWSHAIIWTIYRAAKNIDWIAVVPKKSTQPSPVPPSPWRNMTTRLAPSPPDESPLEAFLATVRSAAFTEIDATVEALATSSREVISMWGTTEWSRATANFAVAVDDIIASVGSLFSIADPGQGTSMAFTEVTEALMEVKEAAQRLVLSGHRGHWTLWTVCDQLQSRL